MGWGAALFEASLRMGTAQGTALLTGLRPVIGSFTQTCLLSPGLWYQCPFTAAGVKGDNNNAALIISGVVRLGRSPKDPGYSERSLGRVQLLALAGQATRNFGNVLLS